MIIFWGVIYENNLYFMASFISSLHFYILSVLGAWTLVHEIDNSDCPSEIPSG